MKYDINNGKGIKDKIFYPLSFYYDNKEKRDENILHQSLFVFTILPFYHIILLIRSRSDYLTNYTLKDGEISIKKTNMLVYFIILLFIMIGFQYFNLGLDIDNFTRNIVMGVWGLFFIYVCYLLFVEYREGEHYIIYEKDFDFNPLDKRDLQELKRIKEKNDLERLENFDDKEHKKSIIGGYSDEDIKRLKGE